MSLLADAVVVLHVAFVVFVVAGGLLVLRWPRVAWVHIPSAAWGAIVALAGWVCPLTPFEVWLRERAGEPAYRGDFIDWYVMPLLYPDWLTRPTQRALGIAVVAVNAAVYALAWRRHRRRAGVQ